MSELTVALRTLGERLPDLVETNFGLVQVCDLAGIRIEKLEDVLTRMLPQVGVHSKLALECREILGSVADGRSEHG